MAEDQEPIIEDRFVDLETKVAYLEYHLEQLNEVVTRQQSEIDTLTAQMGALIKHIQTSQGSQFHPKDEPLPPHY